MVRSERPAAAGARPAVAGGPGLPGPRWASQVLASPLLAGILVLAAGAAAAWLAVTQPDLFRIELPSSTGALVAALLALAAAPVVFLALLRRPALAVAVLVVFVYLNLSEVLVRFHGLPSVLQLLALPLAAAGLRLRGRRGTAAVATADLTVVVVAYLLVVVASTTWAFDTGPADERVAETIKATAVFFLVALLAATPRLLRTAAWAAVAAGSLLAALGAWQAVTRDFGHDFGGLARIKQAQIYAEVFEPRIAGPLGDPNYFAQILLVLVPVALALAWGERDWAGRAGRRRGAALAAAGLLVAGTMLTYSRGAALALAVVLGLAVVVRGVRARHLAAGLAVLLVVLVLAPAGFHERLGTLREMLPGGEEVLDPDSSFAKRRLVTAAAWRMFLDRPALGVGAGNYGTHFSVYADEVGTTARLYEEPGERNFPHNLYLEIAAETGVLGLAAFGLVVLVAFAVLVVARRRLRRAGDGRTVALAEGVGLALAGYLVTGLFLHGEFPRYLYLLLGLAAAIELVSRRGAEAEGEEVAATGPAPAGVQVRRPVAVLLSRFPLVTETFILREVEELERQGQPVRLVPLIREHPQVVHREAEPWVDRALFTPWLSPALAAALVRAAARRPVRLAGTVLRLVTGAAGSPAMLWRSLALVPKAVWLGERLRAEGVRHLHAHFATHPTTAALVAARLAGLGFSFTVHAHDLFVDRHLLAWKLREATFVRGISAFNRDYLVARYPWAAAKIEVVHVGVEPELYAPPSGAAPPEEADAEPVVLSIAALKEYKGVPVLVEACRLLRDAGVRFRCDVVGEGPLRAEVEARVAAAGLAGTVRLLGARRQDEVARRVAAARLVALPSVVAADGQMEGIPVALMEALAAERPVVASRLSGIPELVADGESGLLVPPGDAAALAAALRRLLEDEALARRLGRAGRETVEREFRLADTVSRLLVPLDRHNPPPEPNAAGLVAAGLGAAEAAPEGRRVGLRRFSRGPDAEVAEVLVPPGGEDVVVKRHLDRPGASRPAARRAAREAAVAARVAAWDGAPRPLALDAAGAVVVFARCPGEPMDEVLRRLRLRPGASPDLVAAGAAAGRWLARFQATPLADLLEADVSAETSGSGQARGDGVSAETSAAAPGGGHRVSAETRGAGSAGEAAELEAATAGLPSGHPLRRRLGGLLARCRPGSLRPVPLHGDLWPGNLLLDGATARALDFEGAALGPRYRDAAWFLLHADLYLARPVSARRRRAFADAFLAAWLGEDENPDPAALAFFRATAARRLLAADAAPASANGLRARRRRRLLTGDLRRAAAGERP